MMRGTVYWMAPEVVSSDGGGYDVKVDIWAIGCVALEMWSGTRPWGDLAMMPVMFKVSFKGPSTRRNTSHRAI